MMKDLREELVDALRELNLRFEGVELFIDQTDDVLLQHDQLPDNCEAQISRRQMQTMQFAYLVDSFSNEISADIAGAAERGRQVSKYGIFFHQVPIPDFATAISYAKVMKSTPIGGA